MESSLEIDFFVAVGMISSLRDVDRQLLPGSNPSLLLPEYDDPVVTTPIVPPSESLMTTTVGIVVVVAVDEYDDDDDEDDRGP